MMMRSDLPPAQPAERHARKGYRGELGSAVSLQLCLPHPPVCGQWAPQRYLTFCALSWSREQRVDFTKEVQVLILFLLIL